MFASSCPAARREGAEWRSLTMTSSLQELVRDRVRALPEGTRPLLELIAVVERPTLPLVARALGGVSMTEVLLDDAVAAGAITVGGDGVLRFTHPLLGSAVYSEISPRRRRALHLQVADLVDDLEERARHLSLATSEADETIAEVVERAAGVAAERGASDAAAVFGIEALRPTPVGDEGERVRRTFACAGLLLEAGDMHEARVLIEPFLDPSVPAGVRSRALLVRGETEHQDRQLMMSCFREAIEIAPDPRVRCQALLRHAQHGGWCRPMRGLLPMRRVRRTASRSSSRRSPGRHRSGSPRVLRGRARSDRCGTERRGAARGREPGGDGAVADHARQRGRQSPAVGGGARPRTRGVRRRARRARTPGAPPEASARVPDGAHGPRVRAGLWDQADAYATEARAILDDAMPGGAVVVYYARVLLEGSRGRVEEARRLAAEGLHFAELRSDRINPPRLRWALGHVELRGATQRLPGSRSRACAKPSMRSGSASPAGSLSFRT